MFNVMFSCFLHGHNMALYVSRTHIMISLLLFFYFFKYIYINCHPKRALEITFPATQRNIRLDYIRRRQKH